MRFIVAGYPARVGRGNSWPPQFGHTWLISDPQLMQKVHS